MTLLLAASLSIAGPGRADDSPPAADEIRERRLFREERPLWREALALPADALGILAWPVKEMLLWMEGVNLPARVEDAARAPFRVIGRNDDR